MSEFKPTYTIYHAILRKLIFASITLMKNRDDADNNNPHGITVYAKHMWNNILYWYLLLSVRYIVSRNV